MNTPLVSIIIPTHKRPKLLLETLESIRSQDYPRIEIIVVSNGSSLETKQHIKELNDPKISYYERNNSGTPAGPRNYGIKMASGEYIAFCDDDDVWLPHKLSKQILMMEDNPKIGLSYTKMIRFNDSREWHHHHEACATNFEQLLYINSIPVSSIVVRADLLQTLGPFTDNVKVGTSEDFEFVLRFAANTQLGFIDEFLLKYRSSENRFTQLVPSLGEHVAYLRRYKNCLMPQVKSGHIPFYKTFLPLAYNLLLTIKAVLYSLLQPKQGKQS